MTPEGPLSRIAANHNRVKAMKGQVGAQSDPELPPSEAAPPAPEAAAGQNMPAASVRFITTTPTEIDVSQVIKDKLSGALLLGESTLNRIVGIDVPQEADSASQHPVEVAAEEPSEPAASILQDTELHKTIDDEDAEKETSGHRQPAAEQDFRRRRARDQVTTDPDFQPRNEEEVAKAERRDAFKTLIDKGQPRPGKSSAERGRARRRAAQPRPVFVPIASEQQRIHTSQTEGSTGTYRLPGRKNRGRLVAGTAIAATAAAAIVIAGNSSADKQIGTAHPDQPEAIAQLPGSSSAPKNKLHLGTPDRRTGKGDQPHGITLPDSAGRAGKADHKNDKPSAKGPSSSAAPASGTINSPAHNVSVSVSAANRPATSPARSSANSHSASSARSTGGSPTTTISTVDNNPGNATVGMIHNPDGTVTQLYANGTQQTATQTGPSTYTNGGPRVPSNGSGGGNVTGNLRSADMSGGVSPVVETAPAQAEWQNHAKADQANKPDKPVKLPDSKTEAAHTPTGGASPLVITRVTKAELAKREAVSEDPEHSSWTARQAGKAARRDSEVTIHKAAHLAANHVAKIAVSKEAKVSAKVSLKQPAAASVKQSGKSKVTSEKSS